MRLCRLRTGRFFFFTLICRSASHNCPTTRYHPSGIGPDFICLFPRCGASFPAATLLEAHAIIHANGQKTPDAIDNFPIATGHWSAHTLGLHHGFAYSSPRTHSDPTPCLSGNVYDTPSGLYDYIQGWPNPFNAVGTRGYDYTNPVRNMPSSTFTTINEGTFTQGYGHSAIASHDPYFYGHHQPMPAAPPLNHAVDQTSNPFNNAGPALARPTCMECGRDFGRQSDLKRHMKKHQPDARVFWCQVEGCRYSSIREDKLKEHSRRPH